MGWRFLAVVASGLLFHGIANAADKPELGAPAPWIKPLNPPVASVPQDSAALHVLLKDVQVSFQGDTTRTFTSAALQVAKPEALTALGTFAVAWKPDTDRVIVHWLRIRRGDKVIDVLGLQQFTVLRREQNLEFAALNGILTATMPITGLQVGDIIESAWTIERTEPLLKGHHDLALDAGTGGNVAQLGLSAQWSADDHVVIHSQNLPVNPTVTPTGIALTAGPVEPLVMPQGAPPRYQMGRLIELSDYPDWATVSAIFAPLFATARQIKPDSPLHAEIARIKAATSDPAQRAGLALKLVEDNVRYLYIGLNDGNLRPAQADETWQRRFGDCKAKTALLLALLDGLGIPGEGALVSTRLGDGLDKRLPNVSQFDHVIVRATIAGKVYWLDGTRLGDSHLAELTVPDFHWALPLKPAGGALEALVVAPKTVPSSVHNLQLDASKGIMAPAIAHADATFTGDAGIAMHAVIAAVSKGALDQQLRNYWTTKYDFVTPNKVTEVWDSDTRTERLAMDGTAHMAWNDAGNGDRRYELDGVAVGWHSDFRRQTGPDSDAPFSLNFPDYAEYRETVLLPNDGKGFSISGPNVDRELARIAIYRHIEIAGNRVTMVTRQRPLAAELPYAEALAANDDLRALADGTVDIMVDGKRYAVTDDDARTLLATPIDKTENGYRAHLQAYLTLNDAKGGLAEAQRYAAAFPRSAEALVNRAMFEAASGMDVQAQADAAAALALAPEVPNGKLVTEYYLGQVKHDPRDGPQINFMPWLKWGMAEQCRRQRDYVCAQRNDEAAIALQPNVGMIYVSLANVFQSQGRKADAVDVADRMMAVMPRQPYMLAMAGVVYCSLDLRAKGTAAFGASLAVEPTVIAYLNRVRCLPHSDMAGRKQDIDAALKLDSKNINALRMLADWQGEKNDYEAQIATLQAISALAPADAEPNMQQAIAIGGAYARAGKPDKARESFAEVRGYATAMKNGGYFNSLCYSAATANFDLTTALADCNRAVALSPKSAAVLDSLGFVQLRLGHNAEAIAAYDQALGLAPREIHSLYGRGIAYLRQGDKARGQADLAAAVKLDAGVVETFKAMGITP